MLGRPLLLLLVAVPLAGAALAGASVDASAVHACACASDKTNGAACCCAGAPCSRALLCWRGHACEHQLLPAPLRSPRTAASAGASLGPPKLLLLRAAVASLRHCGAASVRSWPGRCRIVCSMLRPPPRLLPPHSRCIAAAALGIARRCCACVLSSSMLCMK